MSGPGALKLRSFPIASDDRYSSDILETERGFLESSSSLCVSRDSVGPP